MKSFRGIVLIALVATLFAVPLFAAAAEPTNEEIYLGVYLKMNASEGFEKKGNLAKARDSFKECFNQLFQIQQQDPGWESSLVLHRLDDCKAKIIDLESRISPLKTPAGPVNADSAGDFVFPKFTTPRAQIPSYPWKTNVQATLFWIGEGASDSNPTAHVHSAWDPEWQKRFGGKDDPNARNGYSPLDFAPHLSTFYVALPFNDLAYPDKAAQWVPPSWRRPPKDGKPVSACKDRWVEIKNAQGRPCYAQWEDAGPGRTDHAEYVFGNESPGVAAAGLSLSPAVVQYLSIGGDDRAVVSWRFIDPEDVPPGAWFKYEEEALVYRAMHETAKL